MTLEEEVRELAKFAKAASVKLAQATTEERNGALLAMAAALRAQAPAIVEANGEDMEAARAAGTTEALLDRLMLDESRVFAMADALEEVAALPDPLGVVSLESTLYNGIELRRVSVPLGVVAMVYEARPNVTADAAGVCVKSGNACILRGGSLAARSNEVIADVLAAAAVEAGLPRRDHHRPGGHRCAHGAARPGGRAHPPRRRGAYPPLRGACPCAGHRDGHGQLPYLCARNGRFRSRHHHSA